MAEIEKDPSCLQSGWKVQQSLRRRQRHLCRERGCNGFEEYTFAIKRRLASHGFSQSFDLSVDPDKQDKLTTWIEYLNYECWWLDQYRSTVERLQPAYDEAWQDLLSLNILRPHETDKFLRTLISGVADGTRLRGGRSVQERRKRQGTRSGSLRVNPRRSRSDQDTQTETSRDATDKHEEHIRCRETSA